MLINAVFEGGGVKGISLAGAVQAAQDNDMEFHRVAGTSSGSIVAALIAAGYRAEEMKSIIENTPFASLLRRSPIFDARWIGPAARLFLKKGLYSGEALEEWIRNMLKQKGIRTFADLPKGKLLITASDITNGTILVLPDDIGRFGIDPSKLEVAKAVRMSCSIPYFFDPVVIRRSPILSKGMRFSDQFVYVVDGGLLSNFPLWLFDGERSDRTGEPIPVVGFKMVGKTEGKSARIRGPLSMLQALVETMLTAHDERYIEQINRFRTVKIPTLGIKPTQFHLSAQDSTALYLSGVAAGTEFFSGWNTKIYDEQLNKQRKELRKKQTESLPLIPV
ncbi:MULTISPECIES: patatin-like phospholipase family protein [unclassified Paenibacillus]|uniref:patatin-like phospholipase family protein n=1 Tax=unclassified Paenibacillus TaxID=185978 RepID=UPI000FE1C917|nr:MULTISPECIES: patatin-like phospholipase family protein [unclassified Paenibacillus]MCM3171327.1 patatin-like phospholipase family protein [Paenibacillus sp. MER 99-2]